MCPGARQKYLPPYLREPPPAPEPQAPAPAPRQQGQVRAQLRPRKLFSSLFFDARTFGRDLAGGSRRSSSRPARARSGVPPTRRWAVAAALAALAADGAAWEADREARVAALICATTSARTPAAAALVAAVAAAAAAGAISPVSPSPIRSRATSAPTTRARGSRTCPAEASGISTAARRAARKFAGAIPSRPLLVMF